MTQLSIGNDTNRIVELFYLASSLDQLCCGCFQMLRNDIFYKYITACCCNCKHESTCLDLIRNNRIFCLVKFLHSHNSNHIRSCSTNVCAHTVQKVCHINDMRFFRCILNDSLSLSHRCRHHNIDSCTNGYFIHINMCSAQAFCLCNYKSVGNVNRCAHGTESLDVQVDRTASNITSTRKCNFCLFIFSK